MSCPMARILLKRGSRHDARVGGPTVPSHAKPYLSVQMRTLVQFGRKPGIMSDSATGFIFANRVPEGNPSDPSSVLPLLDKVQSALDRVQRTPKLRVHS